ncbi:MAG: hypothetical protein K2I09_00955, partial [Duncaniella sp.]|nr:hypothetical protein [Duncaniella sp.]
MNDKDLDILLDRFASDEITETEQQRLIDRLTSLPEPEMPDMLEERLAETIDTLAATDMTRRAIKPIRHRRMPPLRVITGIAAALAVVITIGVHLFTATPAAVSPPPLATCATPEEANAGTQKAIQKISSGIAPVSYSTLPQPTRPEQSPQCKKKKNSRRRGENT